MSMRTRWRSPAVLLLVGSLLLSACGAGNDTPAARSEVALANTTPAPTGAESADGVVGTPTGAPALRDTPGTSGGSPVAFKFDPATYKKNAIEPRAQLRVSSWGDASEQKVVSDALTRFNQVYPNVKITYEPVPSDYGAKLQAQINSNTQPDVFYLDVNLPYQLIPYNLLLDLAPALTEVGRSKDDYFSSLTEVFLGKNGEVYGLPKDFTSMALFYNTDLVKTTPRAGWTQDDFTAWVKENTTGSGQSQVFGFASDPVFFPYWGNFALANGARVIDNGKCAINSPEGVSTLDWLHGLYKDKFLALPSDVSAAWEGEAFAEKRAASIVVGGWVNPFLTDPGSDFGIHYDAVPLPLGQGGDRATMLGFAGWGASSTSKYPKAAAALVLFLTGRDNQEAILHTGFALPSLKGMENDPFFQGAGTLSKVSRVLYEGASYGVPGAWGGAANPKIQQALNDAAERVFAGVQTGRQALDEACVEIDEALAAVR